jgi:DNA mismatch repair protein MutS2
VSEVNTRKKQAKVEINGVAMWVKAEHLGPASDQKQQNTGHSLQATPGDGKTLELDIRGRRADEAIAELERFLDNALLQGAGSVEIIHGKGTGALRREVHNFLKSYPAIDGFTLANEDRGGDGMTQVTLK